MQTVEEGAAKLLSAPRPMRIARAEHRSTGRLFVPAGSLENPLREYQTHPFQHIKQEGQGVGPFLKIMQPVLEPIQNEMR